jgi:hypothetical protein
MAFTPQNYVDRVGPAVDADWLNGVDETVFNALQGVATTAQLVALVGGGNTPGVNAVVLVASLPSIVVQASSSGVVADFSLANGIAKLFSGTTDVSELATWSITLNGCTATVNTADNTPVNGRPIGYYSFSALPGNNGTATISAIYQGTTYLITVSITKSIAGTPGAPGTPGVQGPQGTPGTAGLTIVLSNPAALVQAFADGSVPSFAGINGQASVLNAGVDVSSSSTWSAVGSGLTGTVNTAAGVPVAGKPIGYYQVTAMTQAVATLTITAVFSGNTLVAVYQVTQSPTGYQIVSSLPVTNLFEGRIVYLTTDDKLYRYTGTAWVTSVAAVDITGLLTAAQIASVAAAAVTGQLTAAQIVSIAAAQLTGQITTTQIANNAITTPLLAAGAVNTAALAAGSVVAATIASGTITAANIAGGTITGANIAAGTILAGNIAAATITAGNLAANSVTATQVAAGAITTNAISAGAVTAAKIGVTQLSAITVDAGAITAGTLSNSGGSAMLDLNNGWMIFNNGVNMVVRGFGFGAASNYLDWFGPSQSSATNFAACTDNLGIYWIKTDGTYKFGASLQASATTLFNTGGSFTYTIPTGKSQIVIELWGDTGLGGHGNGTDPGGGGGSGGYAKSQYSITGHAGQTISIFLGAGNTNPTPSTVSAGTFSITTMSAVGGTGGQAVAFGTPGTGGTASGGNLINSPGNDGGSAAGNAKGGQSVSGIYANGNVGGRGQVSATTNAPGLPAICAITAM